MNSGSHSLAVDGGQLSGLRQRAARDPDGAVREVAQQFEAVLTQQMLSAMRATSFGDDGMGAHGGAYRDMFDAQIAQELARGGGLGLADQLVAQLRASGAVTADGETGDPAPADSAQSAAAPMTLPARGDLNAVSAGSRPAASQWAPAAADSRGMPASSLRHPSPPPAIDTAADTAAASAVQPLARAATAAGSVAQRAQQFVDAVLPHARRAAQALGVPVRAVLAHAALESGWGRHAPGDNYFGIKADASWQGDSARLSTREFENGAMQRREEGFRQYRHAGQSFADYARFLQQNPRYGHALAEARSGDGAGFLQAVARAGYATDPAYAEKLQRIYHSPLLDGALRASASAQPTRLAEQKL